MPREAYLSSDELHRMREEILARGFEADPILTNPDRPTIGLNVAVHWPLPEAFRPAYEAMARRLHALDPGVYVYPFAESHITIATLVSFLHHVDPSEEDRARVMALVPLAAQALDAAAGGLPSFTIDVGPPALARRAAFLPILNPTGEIARLRQRLADALRGSPTELASLKIPSAIHSTVLRFTKTPADAPAFVSAFEEVAEATAFGAAPVSEILITTEPRPYMRAGAIVHRVKLS